MKHKLPYKPSVLYEKCIFASIVNAVVSLYRPKWSDANFWTGTTYNCDYSLDHGAITFDRENECMIGAFRSHYSNRPKWDPECSVLNLFQEAPKSAKALVNSKTMHYLLKWVNVPKRPYSKNALLRQIARVLPPLYSINMPIATTAFWSEGDEVFSCDTPSDFLLHGGEYIKSINRSIAGLSKYLVYDYALSREQIKLANQLFESFMNGEKTVHLSTISLMRNASFDIKGNKVLYGKQEFTTQLAQAGFEVLE